MGEKKKILIVDDFQENIYLLESMLSDYYDTEGVTSATRMWTKLKTMIPSLILLDIMMPVEDGFTIAEKLNEDPVYSKIPVIFVTASDSKEHILKGVALGAKDYVVKPVDEDILLSKIEKILGPNEGGESESLDKFDGNYNVFLTSIGSFPAVVSKILVSYMKIDDSQVAQHVSEGAFYVANGVAQKRAEKIKKELEIAGASVEINSL